MSQVAVYLTIFNFLIVSVLGTNCGWMCSRACAETGCQTIEKPAEPACRSACSDASSPVEHRCPMACAQERVKAVSFCSSDRIESTSACAVDDFPACKDDCTRECIPATPGRCKTTMPRLDFTLEENKPHIPKMEVIVAPYTTVVEETGPRFVSITDSHPHNIHPTISSSVLLL